MPILIAGGARFIGSYVADRLLARAHDLRVLARELEPRGLTV